jgi:hypothetical protein
VAGVVGQGLVEFAGYGAVAAGLALVVVGIAYAGFEAYMEWKLKAKAQAIADKAVRAETIAAVAGLDAILKAMAELARALKDLSKSIQIFFVAAMFLLIGAAVAIGKLFS